RRLDHWLAKVVRMKVAAKDVVQSQIEMVDCDGCSDCLRPRSNCFDSISGREVLQHDAEVLMMFGRFGDLIEERRLSVEAERIGRLAVNAQDDAAPLQGIEHTVPQIRKTRYAIAGVGGDALGIELSRHDAGG